MKGLVVLLLFGLSFIACKKDKLEDGKEIFIGTWNWTHATHSYGWCDGDDFDEILTPESEGRNYSIEFLEKGVVKYYENGEYLEKDRLVFVKFGNPCDNREGYQSFAVYLNNKLYNSDHLFEGCVSSDSLILIRGFPFSTFEEGCEGYTRFFIKG